MNVGDQVLAGGRPGAVIRVFASGWLRVAIDGDKGLPQDYPAGACLACNEIPQTPGKHREDGGPGKLSRGTPAPASSDATFRLTAIQPATCRVCGAPVDTHGGRGRPREFCSARCRVAAHRAKGAAEDPR